MQIQKYENRNYKKDCILYHNPPAEMQKPHTQEHKDAEECKDEAECDLRGDYVAGRPFRHLECVGRLRGKDKHRDKRRDERKIV